MQHNHRRGKSHGVDGAVRIASLRFDNLQDAPASESLQHLRVVVPLSGLGDVQRVSKYINGFGGGRLVFTLYPFRST
jgi:hypothetical protein